ncbi:hypothetical protein LJ739_04240 [Aestuariibacter halophilus]|uniref:Uncharacterized protein n=1 Tax=Fluctibacter halophilus TaxID=226011 RepID=A0ABS8G4K5_9ALTE|nr:hypothetical protein [Aestuariibacter halophilus]MCC2615448.1 hypothetical protein [Aestuariibacter halophilus]
MNGLLDKHSYVKLIEFTIENRNFTKVQACEVSGMSQSDFDFITHELFVLSAAQNEYVHPNQNYEWKLSPQAYFNYLQFCEYQHAIQTSNRAHWTSIAAIVISGALALGSIVVSIYG